MKTTLSNKKICKFDKPIAIKEWETIKWAFREAWKIDAKNMIFWSVVSMAAGLIPSILLTAVESIINSIPKAVQDGLPFYYFITRVVLIALLWIAHTTYGRVPDTLMYTMQTRYAISMQRKYMNFTAEIPLIFFDNNKNADDYVRIYSDVNKLTYFISGCIGTFSSTVKMISLLVVSLSVSPIFLLISIVMMTITAVYHTKARVYYESKREDLNRKSRKMMYYSWNINHRLTARENRMFNSGGLFLSKRRKLAEELMEEEIKITNKNRIPFYVLSVLEVLSSLVIMGVGAVLLYKGKILIGTLVMLWQLSGQLRDGVMDFLNGYSYPLSYIYMLKDQKELFERDYSVEGIPHVHMRGDETVGLDMSAPLFELENVTFGYNKDEPVIKNMNLKIYKGETIALCGLNGAGKSTLIKLLMGIYAPDSGRILYYGKPLGSLSQEFISHELGVVFQDFVPYYLTLRENIAFGDIRKIDNDEVIIKAAEGGMAEKILTKSPLGLDAPMGREFDENGLELSGGEWQRVAVSRAHMSDKPIVILDEPAAKLDPVAEMKQFINIKNILKGRTAIMVSHRMGFARIADKIIVLDNGEVVEIGSHEKLIAQNGKYKEMFMAQSEWYDGGVAYEG